MIMHSYYADHLSPPTAGCIENQEIYFPQKTKQMFAEDTGVEGSDPLKFYIIIIGTKVQHFISYDRLPDIINCVESFQRTVTKQNGRLCTKAD